MNSLLSGELLHKLNCRILIQFDIILSMFIVLNHNEIMFMEHAQWTAKEACPVNGKGRLQTIETF